jgi:23S rRNA (cytosine1962-C5)-methyltransferase
MGRVVLKQGHVQPVWAGHPWVFAQAIERVEGGAVAGSEVDVVDPRGNWLGRGLYSPKSALAVRVYLRDAGEQINEALFQRRIASALERRKPFGLPSDATDAFRVVHAEGDDLPGLIVDRLGNTVVVQLGTIGLKQREAMIVTAIERCLAPKSILDRTSAKTAAAEGFTTSRAVIGGTEPVTELTFRELRFAYEIPLELSQKTGFYLDQRPLRERVEQLARGCRVLDTFTYVGSIAMAAARGGALSVTAVDSSALALEVAARLADTNGLSERIRFERGDALEALNHAGRHGGMDLVICDPPKVAPTRANKKRALDLMRRLAAAGCRATRPGGLLVLCSCSSALGIDDLSRAAALGGRDVGVRPIVLERLFQGPDHPVPAAFPEGLYLSTLVLQVAPR